MDNTPIHVYLQNDEEKSFPELVIRHGDALPLKEPKIIDFVGDIKSPLHWLRKKFENKDLTDCHLKVNRDKKQIVLVVNEKDPYSSTISGKLTLTKIFEDFGINTGKFFTTKQLASFFKMNRSYFASKTDAMELVNKLASFTGKIDGAIENTLKSGEKKALVEKVVKTNLPEDFELILPIFKGMSKVPFKVEIFVDPDNYSIQLNSPDASDLIAQTVDLAIDDVIDTIGQEFPSLVILEE